MARFCEDCGKEIGLFSRKKVRLAGGGVTELCKPCARRRTAEPVLAGRDVTESGRSEPAARAYEKLADEAREAGRTKDAARYQQQAGGAFEAAGDLDAALTAYEAAVSLDATHVAAMAGIGRISMARAEWDQARRVYRSMLLVNLDASDEVSKAEVYRCLGTICRELGESAKARTMLRKGLELDPNDAAIKQALESL